MNCEIKILFLKDHDGSIRNCSVADYSYLDYVSSDWELDSNCPKCSDSFKIKIFFETGGTRLEEKASDKHEVLVVESPFYLEEEETSPCTVTLEKNHKTQLPLHFYEKDSFQDLNEDITEERLDEEFIEQTLEENHLLLEMKPRFNSIKNQLFECDICSAQYSNFATLKRHIRQIHLPDLPPTCICYACTPPRPFKTKRGYNSHKRRHHPVVKQKVKKFICPVCNESFSNIPARETHYINCGSNVKFVAPTCYLCHKVFQKWKSTIRHVEEVHFKTGNFKCDICGNVSSQKVLHENHMELHKSNDPRPYKCHCGKGFKGRKSLRVHQINNHDCGTTTEAICEICGDVFLTRSALAYHVNRMHRERKIFTCPVCNKELHTKYSLKTHMDAVHIKPGKDSEKFPCDQCDYVGLQQKYLDTHKLQHADPLVKPKCSFCNKTFINKNLVRRHEMIHTDSRPHSCDICGRNFRHSFDLKSHLRLHSGTESCIR